MIVEPKALSCWRFLLAARRRRWVGRAAALAYFPCCSEVPSSTSPPAIRRSGSSRARLVLRLLFSRVHRCGERAGRLLWRRRRAAACPCLLVLKVLAITSPTSVSRPSPTRSRSLLRCFFLRVRGIGGWAGEAEAVEMPALVRTSHAFRDPAFRDPAFAR